MVLKINTTTPEPGWPSKSNPQNNAARQLAGRKINTQCCAYLGVVVLLFEPFLDFFAALCFAAL